MDIDKPMEVDDNAQSMGVELGSLFSTKPQRTKPVPGNKFQKRLGAKNAQKFELDERSEFTLSREDVTSYRALSARCNNLSQDHPDIGFASKELCRQFSTPSVNSFNKLKRLVR